MGDAASAATGPGISGAPVPAFVFETPAAGAGGGSSSSSIAGHGRSYAPAPAGPLMTESFVAKYLTAPASDHPAPLIGVSSAAPPSSQSSSSEYEYVPLPQSSSSSAAAHTPAPPKHAPVIESDAALAGSSALDRVAEEIASEHGPSPLPTLLPQTHPDIWSMSPSPQPAEQESFVPKPEQVPTYVPLAGPQPQHAGPTPQSSSSSAAAPPGSPHEDEGWVRARQAPGGYGLPPAPAPASASPPQPRVVSSLSSLAASPSGAAAATATEPDPAAQATVLLGERTPPPTARELQAELTGLRQQQARDKDISDVKAKISELNSKSEMDTKEANQKSKSILKLCLVAFLVCAAVAALAFTGGLAALPLLGGLMAAGSPMVLTMGLSMVITGTIAFYMGASLHAKGVPKEAEFERVYGQYTRNAEGQLRRTDPGLLEKFKDLNTEERREFTTWLSKIKESYKHLDSDMATREAKQEHFKKHHSTDYQKDVSNLEYDVQMYDLFLEMQNAVADVKGDKPSSAMHEKAMKEIELMQKYGFKTKAGDALALGAVAKQNLYVLRNLGSLTAAKAAEEKSKAASGKTAAEVKAAADAKIAGAGGPPEPDAKRRAALDAQVAGMELQEEPTSTSGTPPPTRTTPGTDPRSRTGTVHSEEASAAASSSSSSSRGAPRSPSAGGSAGRAAERPSGVMRNPLENPKKRAKLLANMKKARDTGRGSEGATAAAASSSSSSSRGASRTPSPPSQTRPEITKPADMTEEEWEKTGREAAQQEVMRQSLRDQGLLS